MKILNKELNFDFYNADMMEIFEKEVEKANKQINSIDYTNMKQSVFIKEIYNIISTCFDNIWGKGVSEEIFENKKDFHLCVKAFKDLIKARKEQEDLVDKEIDELQEELSIAFNKYSPNRAVRRNK